MRISDWSSDVCSSDLRPHTPAHEGEGYADHAANDIGDYATRSNGPVAEIAPQLGEMDGGQALQYQHEGKRRQNPSKAGIISCASQRTRAGDEHGAKKAANRQIGPEGCRGKAVVPFASLNQRIRNAALDRKSKRLN